MDETDRRILQVIQREDDLSIREIAERVGLSHTPCWKRMQALQEAGILAGRRYRLDRLAMGLQVRAWCMVTLKIHDKHTLPDFEAAVARIPEVVGCALLTGHEDYMLEIVVRDLRAFELLLKEQLLPLPGVQHLSTRIGLRDILSERPLPV
ncbi:Lrp/AsnC family transcriptional regulator [Paracoccus sp. TOH]|uniref:Lrp/AsnC family transcriptional regulator n=1 Tax=Paracoccus simplex TaxID=2086346 RepID=A0ABV7RSY2_9RHOB|nr:Lrp/AsnC family transcriptional regulator [Paracoccus sp. TOH]WJS86932.1 Lrp/AsnC family transcriptional regulator [Paracoccus sp. TOH]